MNQSSSAIQAENLSVRKNKKVLLDALSFSVQAGSITGLIGPSGSGKTTLMRAIIGVQSITSGSLQVLGMPAAHPALRKKIGYVSQSASVYGDLSVIQNLRYFGSIVRAKADMVETVLEQVDLNEQRDQIVDSLSGGQRARVSLAVALLGQPELLVLDEPTVGLDPVLRNSLWDLFQRLADDGKTLLISSHVMDEADRCERLLLLRDGALLWDDTATSLLSRTHTKSIGDAFVSVIQEER